MDGDDQRAQKRETTETVAVSATEVCVQEPTV